MQAVVLLGAYSMVIGYFNWAASLVASALFVPFIARRNPKADIRLMIAAAYLGLGTVWHGGLSGSAPLILATPGNPLMEPGTGRADHRPLAASDRDAVYPLQLDLSRRHIRSRAGDAVDPPSSARSVDTDRRAARGHDADGCRKRRSPPTPAAGMEHFRGWIILAVVLNRVSARPLDHHARLRGQLDDQLVIMRCS